MDHEATWRRIKDIRFLELAPIGRASECKRIWITRSFGELLKLPEVKECLHARDATIHHRARLGAVRGPAARTRDGSPIRLPSSSHTRPGGLREELVQVLVFGCAYWRIADEECSATPLRRRRDEWIKLGLMDALEGIALTAYDRIIGLELADVCVDGCITKAPCGCGKSGRSPVDRGKRGIKRSTMVDAKGIPLGVVTAGANRHDSPPLAPTLDAAREAVVGLPEH